MMLHEYAIYIEKELLVVVNDNNIHPIVVFEESCERRGESVCERERKKEGQGEKEEEEEERERERGREKRDRVERGRKTEKKCNECDIRKREKKKIKAKAKKAEKESESVVVKKSKMIKTQREKHTKLIEETITVINTIINIKICFFLLVLPERKRKKKTIES